MCSLCSRPPNGPALASRSLSKKIFNLEQTHFLFLPTADIETKSFCQKLNIQMSRGHHMFNAKAPREIGSPHRTRESQLWPDSPSPPEPWWHSSSLSHGGCLKRYLRKSQEDTTVFVANAEDTMKLLEIKLEKFILRDRKKSSSGWWQSRRHIGIKSGRQTSPNGEQMTTHTSSSWHRQPFSWHDPGSTNDPLLEFKDLI